MPEHNRAAPPFTRGMSCEANARGSTNGSRKSLTLHCFLGDNGVNSVWETGRVTSRAFYGHVEQGISSQAKRQTSEPTRTRKNE